VLLKEEVILDHIFKMLQDTGRNPSSRFFLLSSRPLIDLNEEKDHSRVSLCSVERERHP